jgi:hypothetical protein
MNVAKSLWASIQGDPVFMRRVNGWLAVFWIAMIPVSYELGWLKSVVYVSALSLWALVSGHWSAWQAARVEVEQERHAAEARAEPVEDKVVDAIVDKTEIGAARGAEQVDRESAIRERQGQRDERAGTGGSEQGR